MQSSPRREDDCLPITKSKAVLPIVWDQRRFEATGQSTPLSRAVAAAQKELDVARAAGLSLRERVARSAESYSHTASNNRWPRASSISPNERVDALQTLFC